MDLKGRLSNPLDLAETLVAQRSQPIGSTRERAGIARNEGSDDPADSPREEKGRLSNPTQRRLSPSNIDDLIAAYDAGATISQLAADFGVHRTTRRRSP